MSRLSQAPRADAELARTVLNALQVATTMGRLYPNPIGQPGFSRALEILEEQMDGGRKLRLEVTRERFKLNGAYVSLLPPSVERMATALFERGVRELRMIAPPEPTEVMALASLMSEEPAIIEEEGGPKAFLGTRNVTTISVVPRDLEIGEPMEEVHTQTEGLPEELRSLLREHHELAQELELTSSPQEAYEHLKKILVDGIALGVSEIDMQRAIGDTIGWMSGSFRNGVVVAAMEALPDDFAVVVTGQLSDGELSDALVAVAKDEGTALAIAYAKQVVGSSNGRRAELPGVVGAKLIKEGYNRAELISILGSERLLGEEVGVVQHFTGSDEDVLSLRTEASELGGDLEFKMGLRTLQALLKVETNEDEFEQNVQIAEHGIRRWVKEGFAERTVDVIEMVLKEATSQRKQDRKKRLQAAAQSAVSAEVIDAFLQVPDTSDPHVHRFFSLMRERCVPPLVERLGNEQDRARRKVLMDMLSDLSSRNVSLLVPALEDDRWYLVRNVITILAKTQTPDVLPHLAKVATHKDARVRREALRALAVNAGSGAVPALRRALTDPDQSVRVSAIGALGAVRGDEAVAVLREFLDRRPKLPQRERKEILTSLGLQGSSEAIRTLESVAHKRWSTGSSRQLVRHAQEVLSKIGAPPSH